MFKLVSLYMRTGEQRKAMIRAVCREFISLLLIAITERNGTLKRRESEIDRTGKG